MPKYRKIPVVIEASQLLHRFVSYRHIAREIGVDQRTVRRWAMGESVPDHRKIQTVAALDMLEEGFNIVRKEVTRERA